MAESAATCFTSGGVTGQVISSIDWCATPLGEIASWPLSLKSIVGMMLHSRQPMFLWWGPDLVQFYNDAYLPCFRAAEHPKSMGQRGAECWGESWAIMWPQIDDAMSRGRASWNEDRLVPMFRNGRIEEAYCSYGYSPVFDDQGLAGGALLICTETTSRVVAERRIRTIVGLSDVLSVCTDLRSVAEQALEVAAGASQDIPYALVYRTDPVTQKLGLAGSTLPDNVMRAELASAILRVIEKQDGESASAVAPILLPDSVAVACGPWPEPPTEFCVVRGNTKSLETVVFGVSSRLQFDAEYATFFNRFVEQVELASARVEAFPAQAVVRELESANRTKDELLAAVSHELRTPLNAILGWARMLRGGDVQADKVDRALDAIERNSLAQVRLIDDLLDVSRITTGKLRLDVQPMPLLPVVEAAIESMQHALEVKNIRFQHVVDPSAGPISGDAHRIQQVIWNLLSNAVKFTPKGGTVRLVVARVDSSIELSVTDTGQGLPKHLLSTVFDRFKQADSSTSRVHGGLGLGLAIARNIVELHGGTIRVHSEGEGRGATFVVSLPVSPFRNDVRGPFRHPARSTVKLQFERPQELQGLTVLVVDDEADTRELLVEVLQQLGALALTAKSAKEGLSMLDRTSPRVLVSDIGMPDMDGYDFIRAVRERPTEKGGRVVALALTAYASSEDRLRALRAGFQMHLAKPVEPAEFVAALANLAQLAIAMS